MYYIGIDIGSTASKYVVLNNEKNEILYKEVISSGWNSKETGRKIIKKLEDLGYDRKESHITAGTGKFLEVMANRLGLDLKEFFQMAKKGKDIELSSTCTVFAESEVVSLMGKGTKREDIASGVINSIVSKVSKLAQKKSDTDGYFLTGGFSNNEYIMKALEEKLNSSVKSHPDGRFAGAIGAAILWR